MAGADSETVTTAEPALPSEGVLLGGKYRIERPVGMGGMGGVLLARDETLGRSVAVKLILPHLLDKLDSRPRFHREAQAMAAVRHENVVPIFDFGEHEGSPYIVMDYIAGECLEDRLRRSREPMAVDEALALLDAVCQGVAAIHEAGIVHGDVKPSNVLIGRDFHVYVTDFGVTLDATAAATSEGTPGYLAPERFDGQEVPVEKRFLGDIYSLGVMAFELLTGRRPFEAPDAARVLVQQLYKDAPALSSLRPDLPVDFDSVILRAMARDPEMRTQSATEFSRDLRAVRARVPRLAPRSLMVVDDDPAFIQLVRGVMAEELPAVRVDGVMTGEKALEATRGHHYDAIAIDLHLPDVNGLELTALLAQQCGLSTRLLVITGTGAARDWQVLSRLGASDFLLKPVDVAALSASLQRALYDDATETG